ncbi:hypothetical protein LCGC14_3135390, partial [marine sediment metagenome]
TTESRLDVIEAAVDLAITQQTALRTQMDLISAQQTVVRTNMDLIIAELKAAGLMARD